MKKMSVKTAVILLAAILLSPVFMLSATVVDFEYAQEIHDTDLPECFEIAEKALGEYYDASHLLTESDLSKYVANEKLLEYLNYKIDIDVNMEIRSKIGYKYSVSSFELRSWDMYDNAMYMRIRAKLSQQYDYSDDVTGYSEGVELVFQRINGDFKIVEWYTEDVTDYLARNNSDVKQAMEMRADEAALDAETYDDSEKSTNITVVDPVGIDESTFAFLDKLLIRQNAVFDEYDRMEELAKSGGIAAEISEDEDPPAAETASTYRTLDRDRMVDYALRITRCCNDIPERGSILVGNYYDFSEYGSNSYDCTNFVSHCMAAGGARPNDNGWYFEDSNHWSTSWIRVNDLYSFLTNNAVNKATGPYGYYSPWSLYIGHGGPTYEVGDIIQVDYEDDGHYNHSMIITKIEGNGTTEPLSIEIASRTSKDSRNPGINIKKAGYLNYTLRVVKLGGYYI